MNMIMLFILSLVLCAYFWSGSPQALRKNKELLLGILFGYSICYFMDNKLVEGIDCKTNEECAENEKCIFRSGNSPPQYGSCGNSTMVTCGANQRCQSPKECVKSGLEGNWVCSRSSDSLTYHHHIKH